MACFATIGGSANLHKIAHSILKCLDGPRGRRKDDMSDKITARVYLSGTMVEIYFNGEFHSLTAQEAYELAQAINAVLPECVQPGRRNEHGQMPANAAK